MRHYDSINCQHIKAYANATRSQKNKVNYRLKNYLTNPNLTLDSVSSDIQEILNVPCDRKKARGLMDYLGLPHREKEVEQKSRMKSMKETFVEKHKNYTNNIISDFEKHGGDINVFATEWATHPSSFFEGKYGLSQYQSNAIARELKLRTRKLTKTYKDLIYELSTKNINKSDIDEYYMGLGHSHRELEDYISDIVGWDVGEKRVNNLLKYWGLRKNSRDITYAKTMGNRAIARANLHKLERAGYTLESLAHRYENDHSLTKKTLLKELNSTLTKNDQPFTARWLGRHLDPLLTKSRLGSVSREELEFRNVLIKEFPEKKMETSVRDLISPYEIDIYYPDEKLGIEFNGDYWHSDKYMTINHDMTADEYHRQKFNKCKQAGITLLFVWESDWNDNGDEVLQAIKEYMNTKKVSPILTKFSNEDE